MKLAGNGGACVRKVESSEFFKFFSLPAALGAAFQALPEKRFELPILISHAQFPRLAGVHPDKLKRLRKA
jgi:hypothetical protein